MWSPGTSRRFQWATAADVSRWKASGALLSASKVSSFMGAPFRTGEEKTDGMVPSVQAQALRTAAMAGP